MITKLIGKIQYLFKSEDHEIDIPTPLSVSAEFKLSYKRLIIGKLELNNGLWSFQY